MNLRHLVLLVAVASAAPIDSHLHHKFMRAVFGDFKTLFDMNERIEGKVDTLQETLSESPKTASAVRSRRDTGAVEALPQPEKFFGPIILPLSFLLGQHLHKVEEEARNRTIETAVQAAVQKIAQKTAANNTRIKRQATPLFHLGKHLYHAALAASLERPASEEEKEDKPAEPARAKREAVAEALPNPEPLILPAISLLSRHLRTMGQNRTKREAVAEALPTPEPLAFIPLIVAAAATLGGLPGLVASAAVINAQKKKLDALREARNNRTRRSLNTAEFEIIHILHSLEKAKTLNKTINRTRRDIVEPITRATSIAFGVRSVMDRLKIALLAPQFNATMQERISSLFTKNAVPEILHYSANITATPASARDAPIDDAPIDDAKGTTVEPAEPSNRT